jgi:glycine/sarcosine N-methyltransferase
MPIYAALASSYDALFPASPQAGAFLDSLPREGGPSGPRALDAGCATGSHALALAARGWTVVGLDSEAAMAAAAREAALRAGLAERASFAQGDILDLAKRFGGESFDLVLCLGNTLPHLLGEGAASFLAQARELLRPGGSLVLQCLNFALPGIGPGYEFPRLEAGGAVLERRYALPPPEAPEALRFIARLTKGGRAETGEALLQPLRPARVSSLLAGAGFAPPELYSGWGGGPFDEGGDTYLIAVAGAAPPA